MSEQCSLVQRDDQRIQRQAVVLMLISSKGGILSGVVIISIKNVFNGILSRLSAIVSTAFLNSSLLSGWTAVSGQQSQTWIITNSL